MNPLLSPVEPLKVDYERERFEDIGYMTCMTLVLLGNYAQTGHFGGPLAYTPYNVAIHLAGPDLGGLRYDYRRPKHPFGDKFMLAGGHNIPTAYALWMIMGEAMARKHAATGEARYYVDPQLAVLRTRRPRELRPSWGPREAPGRAEVLVAAAVGVHGVE